MIKYSLVCPDDHTFESWFRDSGAFDTLADAGQVACPICGSVKVRKALMAPAVVTGRAKAAREETTKASTMPVPANAAPAETAPVPAETAGPMAMIDEKHKKLRDLMREMHRQITENADNVGRAFPEEARKIHEGTAEPRSIYGEATGQEVKALLDDGVPLMPMPILPDDHH